MVGPILAVEIWVRCWRFLIVMKSRRCILWSFLNKTILEWKFVVGVVSSGQRVKRLCLHDLCFGERVKRLCLHDLCFGEWPSTVGILVYHRHKKRNYLLYTSACWHNRIFLVGRSLFVSVLFVLWWPFISLSLFFKYVNTKTIMSHHLPRQFNKPIGRLNQLLGKGKTEEGKLALGR
jgi:hypothetical protein